MKTLPNGVTIYNVTPHSVRFWAEGWEEPVEVDSDFVASAKIEEREVDNDGLVSFVETRFVKNRDTERHLDSVMEHGYEEFAHFIIVGSIIAAQAYPSLVVAMTPAPGYERVPPDEKRMNPDKFTMFEE